MGNSEWMAIEEATRHLGIGKSRLYELAQSGEIPRHKVGKVWRFSRTELDGWVRASRPIDEFFVTVECDIDANEELRDPQIEAHAAAAAHFAVSNEPGIIQIPVGCGKSGLIALLPFGISQGRVLIIAPNLTIREGLLKNLDISDRRNCFWRKHSVLSPETMLGGPHVAVLDGKDANIHDCVKSHLVLANIQQLASSADRWLPTFKDDFFDLILVDEGHHSAAKSWKKVFNRFPNAKVLNLTATPYRADAKEIDGDLIYRYSFKRAMVKGYIKKLQAVYVSPSELTFTYGGSTDTYTLEDVLELKEEDWFSRGVAMSHTCNVHIVDASLDRLEQLRQTGTKHQIVAVAMQIDHARAVRSLYAERGYEADVIHSRQTQAEQSDVLRKLRAGLLDVIVQVQMLGEGFDHPKLSVAAIFRPFRSIPPYLQFVGRAMRVVVQNDARHPDNYGYIVTHAGMNLDMLLSEFRDIERDDQKFLKGLLKGEEPEPPREVLEGRTRMKLRPDMVVQNEIVDSLLEENFLDADDELLLDELRKQAEALGLDADAIVSAAKDSEKAKMRTVEAPVAFAVNPQRARKEARRRLTESVKRATRVLLNRVELNPGSSELSLRLFPGLNGNNFVAATQILHRRVQKALGIKAGQLGTLDTPDYEKGMKLLPDVLEEEVRRIKAKQHEVERSGGADVGETE